MEEKNGFKIWLFIIFLLTVIVGGYFLMEKYTNKPANKKSDRVETTNKLKKDIRLDKSHDYIYFSDRETIIEELDLSYNKVNINFNDSNNIADKLNNRMEEIKKELTYDENDPSLVYKHLKFAHYPIYSIYEYDNYLSLICDYYTFNNEILMSYKNSSIYVFDKYTGKLYTAEELLSSFKLSSNDVKTKVKTFITDTDLINGEETLDADGSIELLSLDNLFVDKLGRLSISIIVKSSERDYNEIVTLS